VYSALDRLESFRKVADGEVVSEMPVPFVALPVTLTSTSLLAVVSSAGASADSSSAEISSRHLPASSPVTTSGSVTKPVSGLGGMVRRHWKDPASSAVQTQAPKTKVSPRLKAAVFLK
jgi:hypothetical protein